MAKEPGSIRLVGFSLTKIQAEKNHDFEGKPEVKSNIDVKNVEKFKPDLSKQESLKIEFDFKVDYGKLGKVDFEGMMFLLVDPKLMKQVISDWKNKKIAQGLNVAVLNIIVQRASLKAFKIEEELGLPTHIQLPRLKLKQD